MSRLTRRAALLVARARVLALIGGSWPPRAEALSAPDLQARAIYFVKVGDTIQRDVNVATLTSAASFEGGLWGQFVDSWASINNHLTMNKTVPSGLPTKGHLFVVLGSALTSSGGLTTKLERRLKLALAALKAYPTSDVLVSGGAARNGRTEAQVMRSWLIARGVASSRIVLETKSPSTIGNAKYSMALLRTLPEYTSYTLISDSSHLRRATILFKAATVRVQLLDGRPWGIRSLANVAYPDLATAGQGPLSAASVSNTASEVASLFGLSTQYRALLTNPPSASALRALALTPPTKLSYRVGEPLVRTGLSVTARYAGYSRTVTELATISGFTTATPGTRTATVTFTDGGVTKTATFAYTVLKARSTVAMKVSNSRPTAYRTRVVATATVSAALTPTGTVSFYLDGRLRATVKLSSAQRGRATFTYPLLAYLGKRQLTVRYSGNSLVSGAATTVTVVVVR